MPLASRISLWARPIEGTRETVPTFDHKDDFGVSCARILVFQSGHRGSGNVDHGRLLELVGRCLDGCEPEPIHAQMLRLALGHVLRRQF